MSSLPGLSKAVLSPPGKSESQSSTLNSSTTTSSPLVNVLTHFKFDYAVDQTISQLERDNHNKRMKALRKELNNLQATAWKYQPIDKFIGQ